MKIRLLSDLHLEFDRQNGDTPFVPDELPTDSETVLVLAGDIDVKGRGIEYANSLADRFKAVIIVAGNHDYWGSHFTNMRIKWENHAKDNVYPLFNDHLLIDGVLFTGGTLWTDYNNRDSFVLWNAKNCMPEHRNIREGDDYGPFTSTMALADHVACVSAIEKGLSIVAEKHVVITHMAPSYACSLPPFAGKSMEHYFCSNLDWLVAGADMWLFGHTHQNVDLTVGEYDTRLISNQRGYSGVGLSYGFYENLLLEV